jgi:hypothetical protein
VVTGPVMFLPGGPSGCSATHASNPAAKPSRRTQVVSWSLRATPEGSHAAQKAIRRACHVIEFTAYLQPDMRKLDDYLRDKVDVYATLLESV